MAIDMFVCKRCHYQTSFKNAFVRHLQRKQVCPPTHSDDDVPTLLEAIAFKFRRGQHDAKHKCSQCNKCFTTKSNLNAHTKICKGGMTTSEALLAAKVSELERKVLVLEDRTHGSVSTHIDNVTNNIQIINYNKLGNESLDHLNDQFLTHCILNTGAGLKDLLNEIHFHPDHPENNNIRVKSKKHNLLERVEDDGMWVQCDKNNTLDEMIRSGYRILFAHFLNNKDTDDDLKTREESLCAWFTDLCCKSGNEYYRLRRDLYVLILNNTVYLLGKTK
jgi:hypothetical protein